MQAPSGEMPFTRLEKVIFGPGKIAAISGELASRNRARAVIATSRSLGQSQALEKVTQALGGRCAAVFDGCAQHAPASTVRALTEALKRANADTVVSLGGGSVIDSAKVAAASLINGRDMILEARDLDLNSASTSASGTRDFVHIAIPTTLSAAEYTSGGGVTDEQTHRKRGVFDPRVQAKVIIHDPELTLETPDWLWVSTGMRALDHAVEASYSVRRQPFADALATKAIRLLNDHLKPSIEASGAEKLAHRGNCQLAAWFSLFGGVNASLGISHALSHQIGPQWNVPHGVTSCITLPHAMAYMARHYPERFGAIAEGLGIAFDARDPGQAARQCAAHVHAFIRRFDVPSSLKAMNVPESDLGVVAEAARHEIERFDSVGRTVSLEDVKGLLRSAYAGDLSPAD